MRFQGQSALVTGPPGESASPPRSGGEVLAMDVLPIPKARTKSLEMDLASEDGPRRVAGGARRLFARVDRHRQQCRRRRLARTRSHRR
jgi:hypothetical protein